MATTRHYFGGEEDEGVILACDDCGRPTFYDRADERYHHVEDPARGCFLIPEEERSPEIQTLIETERYLCVVLVSIDDIDVHGGIVDEARRYVGFVVEE